jgi:hypothetical protein
MGLLYLTQWYVNKPLGFKRLILTEALLAVV